MAEEPLPTNRTTHTTPEEHVEDHNTLHERVNRLSGAAASELVVGGVKLIPGAGSPEGIVAAAVGSLYLRTDGGGTALYVKKSGTGTTGWDALVGTGPTPAPNPTPIPDPEPEGPSPISSFGFNENGGLVAYDLSAGGYNLAASNAVSSWDASSPAQGASAAATEFTGQPGPNVSQAEYTIMFKARREGTWSGYAAMLACPAQNLWIEAHSSANYVPNFYAGASHAVATTPMALNTWYHIACTHAADGTTKIYIQAAQEASASGNTATANFGANTWVVAGTAVSSGEDAAWNGAVDDLRFFNKVLTQAQIAEWMNDGITGIGNPTGGDPADPSDIPGTLHIWRSDTPALSNGAAVSSWAALAGGGSEALAQATGTAQPSYQTSSINGLPAVRFDGSSDFMTATIAADAQPVTYGIVLKMNSISGYQTIIHNGVEVQLNVTTSTKWEMYGGSANVNGGTPTTDPVILTVVADATDTVYANGVPVASGDGGSSGATTALIVGKHATVGRFLSADVAEIRMWDHALTTAELAIWHSYAQDRYNIPVGDYGGGGTGGGTGGGVGTDNHFGMMVFLDKSAPTVIDSDVSETVATGSDWIRIGLPSNVIGSYNASTFTYTPDTAGMDYVATCCQKARQAGLKVVLAIADTDRNATLGLTEAQYRTYVGQFFGFVASKCGAYVDLWQLWNEFSGRDYRNYAPITPDAAFLSRFNQAIAAGRSAVRQYSAAPVCTTPFGYPINQDTFNKWVVFHDGLQSACDVIGIHGYPETNNAVIDLMASYINTLKARYNKPVAILEFGVPNVSGYGTPTQVGAAIVQQINRLMTTNPLVATLYQLRDRGAPTSTNGEDVFGIIENNFTHKSYYTAVVNAINAL